MCDIFISYAREDQPRIAVLVSALEAHGLSVFWDRQIPAGRSWRDHIGHALAQARCVIAAWSAHSIGSQFVAEEADDGQRRGILVPVLLDAVLPPLGFRSLQAADLQTLQAGDCLPAAFSQLIDSIHTVIGATPTTAAVAPGQVAANGPPPPAHAKARQWRQWVGGLLAALLLLGAGLAWWVWTHDVPQPKPDAAGETALNTTAGADRGARSSPGAKRNDRDSVQIVQAWRTDDGGLAMNVRVTHHGAEPLLLTSARTFALLTRGGQAAAPVEAQPVFETLQRDEPLQFRLRFANAGDPVALSVSLPRQSPFQVELPDLR